MNRLISLCFSVFTLLWASQAMAQNHICPQPSDIRVVPDNPSASLPVSIVVTLDAVFRIESQVSQSGNQILVDLTILDSSGFPPPPGSISHTASLGRLAAGSYDLVIQGRLLFSQCPTLTLPLTVAAGGPPVATPLGGAWVVIFMVLGILGAAGIHRMRSKVVQ